MNQKFLFVSGCPRSGTTVLAHMLNWADEAFVGQERFATLLANHPDRFVPGLFEPARLLEFRPGDCGYQSYDAKPEYTIWYANPKDFAALDEYDFIGDKITNLHDSFQVFSGPAWAGRDVTVVHVIRNVLDVAASYHSRQIDTADGWDLDYLKAIEEWCGSVERAHALATDPDRRLRFAIVDYDTVFDHGVERLIEANKAIYRFAGLDHGPRQTEGMVQIHTNGEHRRKVREPHEGIRADVASRVPAGTAVKYQELRQLAIC